MLGIVCRGEAPHPHGGGGAIELEKYPICIYNDHKMRLEVDGQLPFGSPVAPRCGVVGLQSESFAGESAFVASDGVVDRPSSPGEAATLQLEQYGNGACLEWLFGLFWGGPLRRLWGTKQKFLGTCICIPRRCGWPPTSHETRKNFMSSGMQVASGSA
jgi:hypothetical protein